MGEKLVKCSSVLNISIKSNLTRFGVKLFCCMEFIPDMWNAGYRWRLAETSPLVFTHACRPICTCTWKGRTVTSAWECKYRGVSADHVLEFDFGEVFPKFLLAKWPRRKWIALGQFYLLSTCTSCIIHQKVSPLRLRKSGALELLFLIGVQGLVACDQFSKSVKMGRAFSAARKIAQVEFSESK